MSDSDWLDEIEAREKKATPGKWEAFDNYVEVNGEALISLRSDNPMTGDSSNDSEFIAATREDIPRLVNEVRRLRAENQLMKTVHSEKCCANIDLLSERLIARLKAPLCGRECPCPECQADKKLLADLGQLHKL